MTGRKRDAQGMALVELALVIMILVLLTFGVVEYSWLFFRMNQISNTAWTAARTGALPDATNADVQAAVDTMMAAWGIPGGYTITITPADVAGLEPGTIVQVKIDVPTANIKLLGLSILPLPAYLRAGASLAKEGP